MSTKQKLAKPKGNIPSKKILMVKSGFEIVQQNNPCKLTVKLSLNNCIINVLSLYESSFNVSNSVIAESNACKI